MRDLRSEITRYGSKIAILVLKWSNSTTLDNKALALYISSEHSVTKAEKFKNIVYINNFFLLEFIEL